VGVVFTEHALRKFADLKELGLILAKKQITKILLNPEHIDRTTDYPEIISSGKLDKNHVLRVVHRKERGKMIVITFYPAKAGRYYY